MNAPDPNALDPNSPEAVKRSRRHLVFLASLFFVPLAISFLLYYGELWRPEGGSNKGDLITPARPLPQVALTLADGTQSTPTLLQGKWSWVYIGDGQCDARCRIALADMRQARLLLSDKMERVQRVFLTTGTCCDQSYLASEQKGLIVARFDNAELQAQFPTYNDVPVEQAGRIYVVDPLGNLMMSYAADAPANWLILDIKQLLKLSHIG
jgi:hypothetical protein